MPETGFQSIEALSALGVMEIGPGLPASYSYYRTMRKHPTIALARRLSIAPLLRASWSIEGEDASEETLELAQAVVDDNRAAFMAHACASLYDYGFAAFEQYLEPDPADLEASMTGPCPPVGFEKRMTLRVKPLLADFVKARVDAAGAFAGVSVSSPGAYRPTILPLDQCIFLGLDAEAGQLFGVGYLENARSTYQSWQDVDDGAKRYDRKVAGTHLVLYYPPGSSIDAAGTETDNGVLAQQFLKMLESSGMVAVEAERQNFLDMASAKLPPAWHVEYLSDSSPRQGSFIERARYLDALLVRAFMLPERAILEGEFGTKAEAVAHQNLALQAMEATHEFLAEEFERQALSPYLALLVGAEQSKSLRLSAGPINREASLWKRSLLESIIAKRPEVVDLDALMDEMGLAKSKEVIEAEPAEQEQDDGRDTRPGDDPVRGTDPDAEPAAS